MIYGHNIMNLFYFQSCHIWAYLVLFWWVLSLFFQGKMVINAKKLPWKNVSSSTMGGSKLMKFGGMKLKTKIHSSELILKGYLFSFCSHWAPKLTFVLRIFQSVCLGCTLSALYLDNSTIRVISPIPSKYYILWWKGRNVIFKADNDA